VLTPAFRRCNDLFKTKQSNVAFDPETRRPLDKNAVVVV